MNNIKYLVSTNKNITYMLTSYDPSTLLIFSKPIYIIDNNGNNRIVYGTIQIKKIK